MYLVATSKQAGPLLAYHCKHLSYSVCVCGECALLVYMYTYCTCMCLFTPGWSAESQSPNWADQLQHTTTQPARGLLHSSQGMDRSGVYDHPCLCVVQPKSGLKGNMEYKSLCSLQLLRVWLHSWYCRCCVNAARFSRLPVCCVHDYIWSSHRTYRPRM